MPDATIDVAGYTVTISGIVNPNQTVRALFEMDGQPDIQASAIADSNGNISGSQTLPAAGTWTIYIFLAREIEDFTVIIPGGFVGGRGVSVVSSGAGKPTRFQLGAGSIITDKTKVNALRQKVNLPPVQ
jgi:hypothetical protein